MSPDHLTTITVETPEEARDLLLEAEVLGPSLHPRTLANGGVPGSWGKDGVWNGWNFATTCGRDANGVHVMLRSIHYASGGIDFNGGPVGGVPRGGDLEHAFSEIAFPVEVLPVSRHILHPEFTPEFVVCPECDQGKCGNCTGDILTDDDEWVECLCRHLGAPVSDTEGREGDGIVAAMTKVVSSGGSPAPGHTEQVERWVDLLEDPDGAPYPDEVQFMWDRIAEVAVVRTTEPTRETVVAALESVRGHRDAP